MYNYLIVFQFSKSLIVVAIVNALNRMLEVMFEAMQMAQDAQAGYAFHCCTTRQPMAFHAVKSCCKGHTTLAEHIRQ